MAKIGFRVAEGRRLNRFGRADAQIFCSRGPDAASGTIGFCFGVNRDSAILVLAPISERSRLGCPAVELTNVPHQHHPIGLKKIDTLIANR